MMRVAFSFWITASFGMAALTFIPADESYPLIDRGRVPLSLPGIEKMAEDLAILADQDFAHKPAGLRRQAQLIALAERLSPGQEIAREVRLGLIAGDYQAVSLPKQRKEARNRVLGTVKWLVEEPKGSEGRLLGQLILDSLSGIQHDHPLLGRHELGGINERWRGVVAPLEDFGTTESDLFPETPRPDPTPAPEPDPAPAADPTFLFTELQTATPMIVETRQGLKSPLLNRISLKLSANDGGRDSIRFNPRLTDADSPDFVQELVTFFKGQERPLPSGALLSLETGSLSYSKVNKDNLLAPLAMMLDSALSGKKLKRDVILFAKLNSDGSLSRPARSWELIQVLRERIPAVGTCLLVPPSMVEELTALLVIRDPAFLFKYEVIACRNMEEAAQFYLETNQPPESLAKASAFFQEVSQKASERMRELPSFLVFESVKRRLGAAAQADSRHLSSSVLLRQASARRPTEFSRRVFAMEYRLALANLETSPSNRSQWRQPGTLKNYHLARRKEWREFADRRTIGRGEEDLLTEGQKLIDSLSPIARKFGDNQTSSAALIEYEQWRIKVSLFFAKLDQIANR
ncbi:MAG: hypothetical protein ACON4K_12775 [Akkermansiaceae bacterium]